MKKFYLLTKTLLAAALLAQASTVNAQVEVYDFKVWAPNKTGNTFESVPSKTPTTSTSGETVYMETANFEGEHSFNNRFAWHADQTVSANQGLLLSAKNKVISILGLSAGDIVTIESGSNIYVQSQNVSYINDLGEKVYITTKGKTETEQLVSGKPYTMVSDGTLDFYPSSENTRIYKITIMRPATVTLDNSGYATFASPYQLNVASMEASSGTATAYTASVDAANAKVQFSPLSQSIPANTGILLAGNANATVTIPVVTSSTDVASNDFLVNEDGTTFTAESGYTYFGMKKNEATLTFATFAPGTVAIPANKAYLKVLTSEFPNNARSIRAVFGDDITGISEAAQAEVKAAEDGKFFKNGKFFIVKNGKKFNTNGTEIK